MRGTSALLLYYSYALMEKALIAELEKVGSVFQYLFGTMGDGDGSGVGCERFESMFLLRAEDMRSARSSLAATMFEDGSSSESE